MMAVFLSLACRTLRRRTKQYTTSAPSVLRAEMTGEIHRLISGTPNQPVMSRDTVLTHDNHYHYAINPREIVVVVVAASYAERLVAVCVGHLSGIRWQWQAREGNERKSETGRRAR